MAVQGLHLLKPSSVAVVTTTGGTASINTNGSVSYSGGITAIELRGVFSSEYRNYMIVSNHLGNTNGGVIDVDYMSGTTVNNSSNYSYQNVTATGTASGTTGLSSTTLGMLGEIDNERDAGLVFFIYSPHQSEYTTARSLVVSSDNLSSMYEGASSFAGNDSFDGIKILYSATSGLICVYGFRK